MPKTLIQHPTNGTNFFGLVEEKSVRGYAIPGAPILLKRGIHGPRGGYGVRHIWARHSVDLKKRGYASEDDVAKYVAEIICVGSPIYCEFNAIKGVRVTVVRGAVGLAVLEHKTHRDDSHYSIITAFSQKSAHGTRVGSVANYQQPDAQDV